MEVRGDRPGRLRQRIPIDLRVTVGALLRTFGPLGLDGALYGTAALFCLGTIVVSTEASYRVWAEIAFGPYLAVAIASVLLRNVKVSERSLHRARRIVLVLAFIGGTIAPLAAEVAQRSSIRATDRVQPEIVVIDQAASRLAHGLDPYHAIVRHGQVTSRVTGEPAFESFFPYFPLMAAFGLPSSAKVASHITDTRLVFAVFSISVILLALWLLRAPNELSTRLLQFQLILPCAALPLVTGGDDIPVLVLLFLGIVLAQRQRFGWSGIVFGLVAAMKLTAWPLSFLALFCLGRTQRFKSTTKMLAGFSVILTCIVIPFIIVNPASFVANALLFPVGLAGVSSPAASDLPGHLIVHLVPHVHQIYTAIFLAIGVIALIRRLQVRRPQSPSQVCALAGWVLVYAIAFAPTTRVGYLIYPLSFFLWSWLLDKRSDGQEVPQLEETLVGTR